MLSTDVLVLLASCSLAYYLRFNTLVLEFPYQFPTLLFIVLSALCLSIFGFYDNRSGDNAADRFNRALSSILAAAFMTATCLYLTKTGESYSRLWLGYSGIISVILIIVYRHLVVSLLHINIGETKILLVGGGKDASYALKKLRHSAKKQVSVSDRFCQAEPYQAQDIDTSIADISAYVEDQRQEDLAIAEIWVMQDFFTNANILQLETLSSQSAASVVFIPHLPQHFLGAQPDIDIVEGFPAIHSNISNRELNRRLLKNVEDKSIAVAAILLTAPLWILIACAIKLTSRGPIFYRQLRYGIYGKEFAIWKFRTMYVMDSSSEFSQAVENDPRVTPIGKILRKTSLDELPQLINVIGGSMSLVGPRPHPSKMNEEYRQKVSKYMQRHNVKPGITGLAQIRGYRGESDDESMRKRIESDLEYIENWSLTLDIIILIKTVSHQILTRKAY
ncbi:MAG: exopolysaccharide biosynthesis polyprenyl glycosylphosphotransferase [Pseudomonadota bacterium]